MKVGFSYNRKNLFSKIIARVTSSRWSHSFLVGDKLEDGDYEIFESSFHGGAHKDKLSKYVGNLQDYDLRIYEFDDTDNSTEAIDHIFGTEYGTFQAVGILLAKVFKSTWNIFTKNTICSELVLIWLQSQKKYKKHFEGLNLNYASPEDIERRIKQIPVGVRTWDYLNQ